MFYRIKKDDTHSHWNIGHHMEFVSLKHAQLSLGQLQEAAQRWLIWFPLYASAHRCFPGKFYRHLQSNPHMYHSLLHMSSTTTDFSQTILNLWNKYYTNGCKGASILRATSSSRGFFILISTPQILAGLSQTQTHVHGVQQVPSDTALLKEVDLIARAFCSQTSHSSKAKRNPGS